MAIAVVGQIDMIGQLIFRTVGHPQLSRRLVRVMFQIQGGVLVTPAGKNVDVLRGARIIVERRHLFRQHHAP